MAFRYFQQMGKCMYTGNPIDLEKLGGDAYNKDHIYHMEIPIFQLH